MSPFMRLRRPSHDRECQRRMRLLCLIALSSLRRHDGSRCAPEEDDRFQEMEERIWKVHHPNEPMPGRAAGGGADEDEDIILGGGAAANDLSKNPKCPITGLEVRHEQNGILAVRERAERQLSEAHESLHNHAPSA